MQILAERERMAQQDTIKMQLTTPLGQMAEIVSLSDEATRFAIKESIVCIVRIF